MYIGGVRLYSALLATALTPNPLCFPQTSNGCITGTLGFDHIDMPSDIQSIVPDPTEEDAVYVGGDKGVCRYSATLNALSSHNAALGVTQVYLLDVHPRHGGLFAAGSVVMTEVGPDGASRLVLLAGISLLLAAVFLALGACAGPADRVADEGLRGVAGVVVHLRPLLGLAAMGAAFLLRERTANW